MSQLPTTTKRTFLQRIPQFLFATLLLVALKLSAQNPFIKRYTIADGLPSNMVYQVYQDSKKFIWFAMTGGLVRYNGSTFTVYGKKDGLSYFNVSNLHEDSFGRIWIFCPNGKTNFFYQNKIYNETNAPFLDSIKFVRSSFQDKDRIIYFYDLSHRRIYALDTNNRITKYEIPSIPIKYDTLTREGMIIMYLTKSVTGDFLIWTPLGVFKTRDLSQKPVLLFSISKDYKILPCGNNTLFARVYNTKTQKYVYVKYFNGFPIDSTELPVKTQRPGRGFLEDTNGLLWICTLDKGVFCLKNKQIVYHFDLKEADHIMQDYDNNIWISGKKGVYKISPYSLFSKHYSTGYFHNQGIEALGSDPENGVWFTNGEMTYLLKNNEIYGLDCHSQTNRFTRFIALRNNRIIISNFLSEPDNFLLSGIKTDPLTKKVYFKHKFIIPGFRIAIDNTGREFSAFVLPVSLPRVGGVVTFSLGKQFSAINRVDIFPFYGNLFYNRNNNLIINAEKNYILQNNKILPCPELSIFNGKIILSHYNLNKFSELYFTEDLSIYLINNNKTYNVTSSFGFSIDFLIYRVKYDDPTLYLASASNIYLCDDPLQILKKMPLHLRLVDINFRNIHDILVKNDSLYVASDDGLTVIPDALIRKSKPQLPLPYFQSIMVNDTEAYSFQKEITLTGNNKIKFSFNSINYSATPHIYSYKLEGVDQDWTSGSGNTVVYQNLSRGNYIFKVRAGKVTTEWGDPIEFKITIKAHFWQHPLFFVFLSLLFIGLIALLIIRRKNIQIKRRDLDHQLITLEQQALQSMMNPHFIFNALSSIQSYLLKNKSREAGLYLSQFARLIRQNLSAINSPVISLEEEIDRLKNYLDLERFRMSEGFDYTIEMDENVEEGEVIIPSMIIQPFAENAILHGISALDGKGTIRISISMHSQKALTIIIEDNGIGMQRSGSVSERTKTHLHLGMGMTRKRLEIIGKKMHVETSVEISEAFPGNPNPGTLVAIVVPVSA